METTTSLWDIETIWFTPPRGNNMAATSIPYRSWKEFMDCRPYHRFKPYIVSSWAWKDNNFQLIFMVPAQPGISLTYIEFPVKKEDEPEIRAWIKKHLHPFWKI
jgi:hypothetical protein